MVSSTDLFDGELFGDELIDIYNSTVAEAHGNVDANGEKLPSACYPFSLVENE